MSTTLTRTTATHPEPDLLGVYLNDHAGGALAGVALARRLARSQIGTPSGAVLASVAEDIAGDRRALHRLMGAMGVPIRRYKLAAAWLFEKTSRLKPNRRLLRRSPLSTVLELEALRLGLEGKAALWRTLRVLAADDRRLNTVDLDRLTDRVDEQIRAIEPLRLSAANTTFTRGSRRSFP